MSDLFYSSATEVEQGEVNGDVTINEALWRLEWWGARLVQGVATAEPPASVTQGHAWVIGVASTSSVWAGREDEIGHYFRSAWHFYNPVRGLKVTNVSTYVEHYYSGAGWAVYASAP